MSLKQSMWIPNNADKLGLQAENEPQNPDGVKTETITALAWLRTLVAWSVLALALWATEPAKAMDTNGFQQLADVSWTMLVKKWQEWTNDPRQVRKIAENWRLSEAEIQSLVSMAEKTQSLRDSEGRDILKVEAVSDVSQLVNDGNRVPTVNIYKPLTQDNYTQIVEELFDTKDINDWLINPDGSELNKEQKEKYIAVMKYEKNKYLKKIDDFRKIGWEEAVAMFLDLYNKWAVKLSRQGREFLRRLFVASSSIVFYKYTTDNMKMLTIGNTVSQAWEYIILTSNWKVPVVKAQIQIDTKTSRKYLLPSDQALKTAWIYGMDGISTIALRDLTTNYDNLYRATLARQKWAQLDAKWAQLDKSIEAARQEKEAARQEINKSNKSIEAARQEKEAAIKIQELGKKARLLSAQIEDLVNQYINNSNNSLKNKINNLIAELMDIRKQAKTQLSEKDNKEILDLISSAEKKFINNFLKNQKS